MPVQSKMHKKPAARSTGRKVQASAAGNESGPMVHASAAAETFAEQPKHARAVDKESATGFARGPTTQNDLFNNWAQKAAFSLRMVPRLKQRLDRILSRAPVVIYSDHSGSGNGEEGLMDVLEMCIEASGIPAYPGSPVAWSCCDLCPDAQKALTATSRCQHLFNRVEDLVDDGLRRRLMKKLPKASDNAVKRLQKIENMSRELSDRSQEYFPPGRTAECLWTGQRVPVMAPVPDDGSEPLNILISGTACQDFSSMNQSASREAGESQIVFQWWKHNLRASGYDMVFHENVMRFNPMLLHDAFSDLQPDLASVNLACRQ